jgi:predicted ArsR family transcriptional regulator
MTKLTDTQLVILSAAAGRESRAVLPLPKSLKVNKGAATTALKALIKKGVIEESLAAPGDEHWRKDGDGHKITLTITDAGLAALDGGPAAPPKQPKRGQDSTPKDNTPQGKAGTILGLLKRPKGARITELQKATGWQAHSIRAALTGLRKRDITITRFQDDGVTVYQADGA